MIDSVLHILRPARGQKLAVTLKEIPAMISRNAVLPATRALALRMIDEYASPEHDRVAEFYAIAEGVKKRIRYTRDPHGVELLQDLGDALATGAGDCDDYTIALGSLYQSVGFPVRIKVVGKEGRFSIFSPRSRSRAPTGAPRAGYRWTWPAKRAISTLNPTPTKG